MAPKPLLLCLHLVLCLLLTAVLPATTAHRVSLTHVDSRGGYSMPELIGRAVSRSQSRASELVVLRNTTTFTGQSMVQRDTVSYEYLMDVQIGTPAVNLSLIMDTGSNLIWTKCVPCRNCLPITTLFDPSNSSSYSEIDCTADECGDLAKVSVASCNSVHTCEYIYAYADKSFSEGVLAKETFTFGPSSKPVTLSSVAFGCTHIIALAFENGTSGLVGLGIGNLSLLAHLDAKRFSYCLTNYFNYSLTSTLFLGSSSNVSGASLQSTPLLSDSTFYYVNLTGISLGSTLMSIPAGTFNKKSDGSGGLFFDSGTSFTHLVEPAYSTVIDTVESAVNLTVNTDQSTGLDLCFNLKASDSVPDMPDMVFHFDGADMTVPKENYMIRESDYGLLCLAMSNGTSFGFSIFGNYQQQNMQIQYDHDNMNLSFQPAQCHLL